MNTKGFFQNFRELIRDGDSITEVHEMYIQVSTINTTIYSGFFFSVIISAIR